MSSKSETKNRPRIPPTLLTRLDIDAIRHAKNIHGGIKKYTEHYKIGSPIFFRTIVHKTLNKKLMYMKSKCK